MESRGNGAAGRPHRSTLRPEPERKSIDSAAYGADMPWEYLETGEPRLLNVARVLRAVPLARIKAGPALVFNAAVVDVRAP